MDRYNELAEAINSINSPDGSIVDITDTEVGKLFKELFTSDEDELLKHLYSFGYEELEDQGEYITFGLTGNSKFTIKK